MSISIPNYIQFSFILIILASSIWFYFSLLEAGPRNKVQRFGLILLVWIGIQSSLTIAGFYSEDPTVLPPRFLLLVIPPFFLMIGVFISPKGRSFLDRLNIWHLTLLHLIRVPVEIVLYWLFLEKAIPEAMTFEGRNFDIIAGITAPFVVHFWISKGIKRTPLIIWNLVCLGLLLNILITAVLSIPLPFQQFGLDQPNLAVFYFPMSLLPGLVVPMVFFSHLATLRILFLKKIENK